MSKLSVAQSKAHLDIEMRNIVRKVAHRPADEIVQIVKERTHATIDRDYLATLLREFKGHN